MAPPPSCPMNWGQAWEPHSALFSMLFRSPVLETFCNADSFKNMIVWSSPRPRAHIVMSFDNIMFLMRTLLGSFTDMNSDKKN